MDLQNCYLCYDDLTGVSREEHDTRHILEEFPLAELELVTKNVRALGASIDAGLRRVCGILSYRFVWNRFFFSWNLQKFEQYCVLLRLNGEVNRGFFTGEHRCKREMWTGVGKPCATCTEFRLPWIPNFGIEVVGISCVYHLRGRRGAANRYW